MSRLIALLPKAFRARYEEEIIELLESSDRPTRDRIDIVRSAMSLRMEDILKNKFTLLMVAAVAIAAASFTAFVFAVPELAGGLRDVPRHWWSSAPVVGMAVAFTLFIVDVRRAAR